MLVNQEFDPFIAILVCVLATFLGNVWQSSNLDLPTKLVFSLFGLALIVLASLHIFLTAREEENAWKRSLQK